MMMKVLQRAGARPRLATQLVRPLSTMPKGIRQQSTAIADMNDDEAEWEVCTRVSHHFPPNSPLFPCAPWQLG
jgi:hypothetical protein